MIDGAAHSGGRRPKASKGGNRAWWAGKCGGLYGDLSSAGDLADGVRTGAAVGTTLSLSLNGRWAASNAINDGRMGDDR
ncbi:hypothetical protein [Bradyrhizobium sp. USDA 4529]